MITSLYSRNRRRSEYGLVITEPEATNSFSINFQVSTNFVELKKQEEKSYSHWSVTITSETVNLDQSELENQ